MLEMHPSSRERREKHIKVEHFRKRWGILWRFHTGNKRRGLISFITLKENALVLSLIM